MTQEPTGIRASDLRQWAYCGRVLFYRYVAPVPHLETHKMRLARRVEGLEQALENRRTAKRYGLSGVSKRFDVFLESEELGLSGRLDLLLEDAGRAWPVEVKDTTGGLRDNHVVQLAAYGLLVEACLEKKCSDGYVYFPRQRQVRAVTLDEATKEKAMARVAEIRAMIEAQVMPPRTNLAARCRDCEYRNYCGDVF